MDNMTCRGIRYVIRQGDSLYKISRIYRVPLALLLRANPYVDVYNLQVGEEICIPLTPQPLPRTQAGAEPMNQPERMPGGSMMGQPERMPGGGMMGQSERMSGGGTMSQSERMPGGGMMGQPERMSGSSQERPSGAAMEFPAGRMPEVMPENRSGRGTGVVAEASSEEMEEAMMLYVIQAGDTLEGLLERFALSLEDFLRYNQPAALKLAPGSTVEIPQNRLNS